MNPSSLLRLDWNGATITRRANDNYVNATAMCKANGKLWGHFFETDRCSQYLEALSGSIGKPIVGTDGLVQTRAGRYGGTWVHPDVATELARWISPAFSVAINQWFRQEVERQQQEQSRQPRQGLLPCAVPMAEAIIARRDRNVEVSKAAAEREVPFHELHNARNVGLTGHTAKHWREVSGVRNWIEKADWEHQQLHSVASQAGLNAMKQLNPEVSQADDYVQAMSGAASDLREFAKKYNMPWQPRFMPHRVGTPRAERVLAAASDQQLPLLA